LPQDCQMPLNVDIGKQSLQGRLLDCSGLLLGQPLLEWRQLALQIPAITS
jgi:hypothetical protein